MFNAMLRVFATETFQGNNIIAKEDFPFMGIRRNRALETTASDARTRAVCFVRGDVDRPDLNVEFERVLVDQCGAPTKVCHKELARDVFMLKKLHRLFVRQQCATSQRCDSRWHSERVPAPHVKASPSLIGHTRDDNLITFGSGDIEHLTLNGRDRLRPGPT